MPAEREGLLFASRCLRRTMSHALLPWHACDGLSVVVQVCMMRLIINGRLRVTLSPLMNKMPIVGAAKFSLVQMPEFRCAPAIRPYTPQS